MLHRFAVCCLLAIVVGGRDVRAESPAVEAARIAAASQTQIEKTHKDSESALQTMQEETLKELKKIQDKLTMQALLDEAVVVRDFLKVVQERADVESRRQLMESAYGPLPEAAKTSVEGYLKSSLRAGLEAETRIQELEADRKRKLEPLFEKATKAGDLDGAIAIRTAMSGSPTTIPPAASPASVKRPKFTFSKIPQQARTEYQQQLSRLAAQENELFGKLVQESLPGFQAALAKETRAGELEMALKIRNLVQGVSNEKNPSAQVTLIRNAQPTLAGDAAKSALSVSQRATEVSQQIQEIRVELGLAFASVLEAEVQRVLLTGDANASRMILHEYYFAKQTPGMIHGLNRPEDDSSLSEGVLERLAEFRSDSDERIQAAQEREEKRRASLVIKLREILTTEEMNPEPKQAIESLIEFAQEGYTQGLMAMLLFPQANRLSDAARGELNRYRQDLKSIRADLQTEHAAAVKAFSVEMQAVLRERVLAGSYIEACNLRERLTSLDAVDEPLPIKVARSPFADHLWDAKLFEVRGENSFRIRFDNSRQDEWLPRSRIKFHPDDQVAVAKIGHQEKPPEGPGIPLTTSIKVKRGQKAFKFWGSSWNPVTIQSVVPEGIRFTWDGWSNREETCARSELRLLED